MKNPPFFKQAMLLLGSLILFSLLNLAFPPRQADLRFRRSIHHVYHQILHLIP